MTQAVRIIIQAIVTGLYFSNVRPKKTTQKQPTQKQGKWKSMLQPERDLASRSSLRYSDYTSGKEARAAALHWSAERFAHALDGLRKTAAGAMARLGL